jgi:hypothetical protein
MLRVSVRLLSACVMYLSEYRCAGRSTAGSSQYFKSNNTVCPLLLTQTLVFPLAWNTQIYYIIIYIT